MPGPFTPVDDLIGPVITQLSTIINAQIVPPPARTYTIPPDGQPEHNSLVIAVPEVRVLAYPEESSTAKLGLELHIRLVHFFHRSRIQDDVQNCYNWLHAYFSVLSAWANQELMDAFGVQHARQIDIKHAMIMKSTYAQTPMLMLIIECAVKTEFNIPLN